MPHFHSQFELPFSTEEAFAWHARKGALTRLMPPWQPFTLIEESGIRDGDLARFRLKKGPLHFDWTARHDNFNHGVRFQDIQVEGPFRKWEHTHRFENTDGGCRIHDEIDYDLPLGALGNAIAGGLVERDLERTFSFRGRRTLDDLTRHERFADKGRKKIAVSGASGLVGTQLCAFLSTGGHEIWRLVRREVDPARNEIYWNPASDEIDAGALEGFDAIIHLAGENIAAGRWNDTRKQAILESRRMGTDLVARTIATLENPPAVFISASGIGAYGDTGDQVVDEQSAMGEDFLAEVCKVWEGATEPATKAGIRTVQLRTGVVLSSSGGALEQMLMPFRLGAGGRLGSGRQYFSWIGIDDLVGAYQFALFNDELSGPINACAPDQVTNLAFTKTLGRVLRRPTIAPLPGFVVRTIFGEMGQALLLSGQRAVPAHLSNAGFEFLHGDLEGALRHELGK